MLHKERINFIRTLLENGEMRAAHQQYAKRCLLDILGNGFNAQKLPLRTMMYDYVQDFYPAHKNYNASLLYTNAKVNYIGAALYAGTLFDALDGHDGHPLVKGHAGAGLIPVLLSVIEQNAHISGAEFLRYIIVGYEVAIRLGLAQHASVADYHTSGAWNAIAAAIMACHIMGGDNAQMRHSAGIAEYYGPRSQMMRCIDYPTNVKDGSAWGAMVGMNAALLGIRGFSGAPSLVLESEEVEGFWQDFGDSWYFTGQYFKPWPVCRWAQSALQSWDNITHKPKADDIKHIIIYTFHESLRLQGQEPKDTEEAQYAIAYPLAAYIKKGQLGVDELMEKSLFDEDILSLSRNITLQEHDAYNKAFPAKRFSHLDIESHDGTHIITKGCEAKGTAEMPLTDADILAKYKRNVASNKAQGAQLYDAIMGLEKAQNCTNFFTALQHMNKTQDKTQE